RTTRTTTKSSRGGSVRERLFRPRDRVRAGERAAFGDRSLARVDADRGADRLLAARALGPPHVGLVHREAELREHAVGGAEPARRLLVARERRRELAGREQRAGGVGAAAAE